jgi:CubicO group peptidase (beta-lactamase class C family)
MSTIDGLCGAVLVTRAGSTVFEAAAGRADGEVMSSPQTRFQIASISKQFAAAAVLLLVEVGVLDLSASVQEWLPDTPTPWRAITLHHLLSQTSGIRHWDDLPGFVAREPMSVERRVELFAAAPLLSEPGAVWRYSSPGYITVGSIVSRATGRPYGDLVSERILTPLGLTSTSIGTPPAGVEVARGHQDGAPVAEFDLRSMPGTGDIVSTVGDVARFTAALHGGDLLSDDSVRAMRTLQTPLDRPDLDWARGDGYGYGLFIGDIGGEPAYFHPGDNPGFKSFSAWLPGHEAAIALLLNDQGTDVEQVLRQLLPFAVGSS